MSDDDPFDEDRTVLRPTPGGRRPGAGQAGSDSTQMPGSDRSTADRDRPASSRRATATVAAADLSQASFNPLVGAATSLLGLAIRLKNSGQLKDVDSLRRRVIEEVKAFERRANETGLTPQSVRAGRYALCATLDDLVLNTPWGAASAWGQQSMVALFHNETSGGERFYDLLEKLERDPGRYPEVLELMYLCLSLGFEGQYRVMTRGSIRHGEVREGLFRLIRSRRGDFERDLSPRWRGVDAGHKPLSSYVPLWVIAVGTAAFVTLMFVLFSYSLNNDSDVVALELQNLPPSGPVTLARADAPPPPPPPEIKSELLPRIKGFLEDEIAQGLVVVSEDVQALTIRVRNKGLFGSGSAVVQDRFQPILERIGTALKTEPGKIIVAGHSDNVPIRTVRFPSNWHLSLARASSVAKILTGYLQDPGRMSVDGRADNEPIASNKTAEGRAENRRIEIILIKEGAVIQ
ncbi:type VI secretion system protein TssL, long form [Pelagibius sp. Alg239-R121]|uniref:type VI secretion system protein TssL, long form n=1 Tax=Pelagibius sp. Alg239-R121 TaxID=2993448 RepID=UPI0024A6E121|nr:type VI secretion system protein TssL, long form [Pelagibius sp. Alg239-R121]